MEVNWQAVFFDFDGVILDSVNVKTQAFAAMFRSYGPEVEQAVVAYHLANGGISRFRKFEHYYRHILQKPITPEILDELGREFSRLVWDGVLAAPFVDGVLDTLKELRRNSIPAFVVSGTPDEEIRLIVEKRDLASYFVEVHGSPRKKSEIVRDIAERRGYQTVDCLFVGDALTDYEAARACGMEFLGIAKDGEKSPFPEGVWVRKNVVALASAISE